MRKLATHTRWWSLALVAAAPAQLLFPTDTTAPPTLPAPLNAPQPGNAEAPPAPSLAPATKRWDSLFKVEKEVHRVAQFRARGVLLSPDPSPDYGGLKRAVFVMPWVEETTTSRNDPAPVMLTLDLNGHPVDTESVWIESPEGMQRLRAELVRAPGGQEIQIKPNNGNAVIFSYNLGLQPGNPSSMLVADLTLDFSCVSRHVRFDESAARRVDWPRTWPREARGALEPQVFLDSAIDPKTRLVREIDLDALDRITQEILRARGIWDPGMVKPLTLMREVASEVLRRVRHSGDAVVTSSAAKNSQQTKSTVEGAAPVIEGMSDLVGAFEGFNVRDALSVLRSRSGANQAERAVALAAVLRRAGLPARVVIGFEAEREEDVGKTLAKHKNRAEWIEAQERARLAEIDRLRPLASTNPCAASRLRYYETLEANWPIVIEHPRFRFWVEAALYFPENGLAWIPIDPGIGGETWRVGSVKRSEDIVVLATNFWPTPIRMVGAVEPSSSSGVRFQSSLQETIQVQVNPDGTATVTREASGSTNNCSQKPEPARTHDLAAGLWGFWIDDALVPTYFQQLNVAARQTSVTLETQNRRHAPRK